MSFLGLRALLLKQEDLFFFFPVSTTVLDDFLQLHLGLGNLYDTAEVLAEIVAAADTKQRVIGRFHQGKHLLLLLERADHAQAFERKRFQRLTAAIEIGREAARARRAARRLDLARLERIDQIEGGVV